MNNFTKNQQAKINFTKSGGLFALIPLIVLCNIIFKNYAATGSFGGSTHIVPLFSALWAWAFCTNICYTGIALEKSLERGDSNDICQYIFKTNFTSSCWFILAGAVVSLLFTATNHGNIPAAGMYIINIPAALFAVLQLINSKGLKKAVEEIALRPDYGNFITKNFAPKLTPRRQYILKSLEKGNKYYLYYFAVSAAIILLHFLAYSDRRNYTAFILMGIITLPMSLLSDNRLKKLYQKIIEGQPFEECEFYLNKARNFQRIIAWSLSAVWVSGIFVMIGSSRIAEFWYESVNPFTTAFAVLAGSAFGSNNILKEVPDIIHALNNPAENTN